MSVLKLNFERSHLRRLGRAAFKSTASIFRNFGALKVEETWPARAAICETCPLRVILRGVSYCGRPLLEQPVRDPTIDGCGCPTISKAKTPDEHCPLDSHHHPANSEEGGCNCKWCAGKSIDDDR